MLTPTLATDRLTLGPLRDGHLDAMAAFYADDRSRFVGGPLDRARTWRMMATEAGHWTLRGYGRFAVTDTATGALVGLIGPWNPEGWPEPELGWDLMNGQEGRGYATEAARAARDWCYGTLGWTTAISLVADGNDGSARVAERLGATLETRIDHPMFGPMSVWRHPSPAAAGTAAAAMGAAR